MSELTKTQDIREAAKNAYDEIMWGEHDGVGQPTDEFHDDGSVDFRLQSPDLTDKISVSGTNEYSDKTVGAELHMQESDTLLSLYEASATLPVGSQQGEELNPTARAVRFLGDKDQITRAGQTDEGHYKHEFSDKNSAHAAALIMKVATNRITDTTKK